MKIDTHTALSSHPAITATIAFIQEAHAGQKYGNMPYFFHPIEVAQVAADMVSRQNLVESSTFMLNVVLAALMHDVIEDTPYTADHLRERFGDTVVDAVVLLTKDETLNYRANIQRIIDSTDIIAMIVKLADNKVNRDGDKSAMDPARAEKLNTRYDMSIEMLSQDLKNRGLVL